MNGFLVVFMPSVVFLALILSIQKLKHPWTKKMNEPFIFSLTPSLYVSTESSTHIDIDDFSSLEKIQKRIWNQIEWHQEFGDCERKKILYCQPLHNFAGFGSMAHRYGACIQVAFALGRTFFIHQSQYAHFGGLSQWLLPESIRCGHLKREYYRPEEVCDFRNEDCYLENGYEINNTYTLLKYSPEPAFPAPRRIPGTVPGVIENALRKLNIADPKMWFAAQFLGYYLSRTNTRFKNIINRIQTKHFEQEIPLVAMHLRHGDKLLYEAKYIPENEFLNAADIYLNKTFSHIKKRTIFVASDDSLIYHKIKNVQRGDHNIIMLSKEHKQKGSDSYFQKKFPKIIIESILLDIYFLVHTDFTVCTFTSNICRLAYLLKLTVPPYNNIDSRIKSLGDGSMSYHFYGYSYGDEENYITSVRTNTDIWSTNGKRLLTYKAGQLFRIISKHDNLLYATTLFELGQAQKGFIYKDDVISWPGTPSYHLHQDYHATGCEI